MTRIATLPYAPITEVCVGFNHLPDIPRAAFGALVPSKEQRKVLGILFPSSCFKDRTPYPDGALFTIFMGGLRNKGLVLDTPLEEQKQVGLNELYDMMKIPRSITPDMVPVSYTHLDVYKRQPMVSALSPTTLLSLTKQRPTRQQCSTSPTTPTSTSLERAILQYTITHS